MRRTIATMAGLACLTLAACQPATPAPQDDPLHWSDGVAVCLSEDGSTAGQEFPCRWEAAHLGNGQGRDYTLVGPGQE